MRQIARRMVAGLLVVVAALLVLGAAPSYLAAGEPYHLTAAPTDATGPAVNATDLSERRYPYLTTALAEGRSAGYRRGPFGLKESFSHSPFDEVEALAARRPAARADGGVRIVHEGTRLRVEVVRA